MQRLALITSVVLGTLLGVAVLWELHYAVLLFFLSLGLSAAVRPGIELLHHRGCPRWLALGLTYISIVMVLGGFAAAAAPRLGEDCQKFADKLIAASEHINRDWPHGNSLQQWLARRIPGPDQIAHDLQGETGIHLLQAGLGLTVGLFETFFDALVVFVLSLYWSADQVHFERLWLSMLPVGQRERARDLWRNIDREVGAYLRSEGLQCLGTGLCLACGYHYLGQPYPMLIAVLGALSWLVPWFGVLIAVAAICLVSLPNLILEGPNPILPLSVAYTLIVMLVFEFAVEPRLFNRHRYNTLILAIVILCLASYWGLGGMLIGPLLAMTLQIATTHLLRRRLEPAEVAERVPGETIPHRLKSLQAAVANIEEPPRELVSMVERLTQLVNEAELIYPEMEPELMEKVPVETIPVDQ